MKKKILIGLGGFVVFVILVLLLIPQFYSLDNLRPQILDAVNKQVAGKVSIEKLDFRLFPSLRFRMDGLKATAPGKNEPWLELKSLDADVALWSLLIGPSAKVVLRSPTVVITKGPEGTFNFEDFLGKKAVAATPAQPTVPAQPSAPTTAPKAAGNADVAAIINGLPTWMKGILFSARFGVAVDNGTITFSDPTLLKKGDKVSLTDVAFHLKNVGFNVPMTMDSNVGFDVAFGGAVLKGPFIGKGTMEVVTGGKGLKLKIDIDESFDKTDLHFSNLFKKAEGRALGAKVTGEIAMSEGALNVDLSSLELRLDKTRLGGTVKLKNMSATSMGDLDVKMNTNDIDLSGFGVLIPMVHDYKLVGKSDLSLSALGSPLDPALLVTLDLKGVGGSTPKLQHPLKNLHGKIRVSGTPKNPLVSVGPLAMGVGSSDLNVNLTSKGLNPAIVEVNVESNKLDADEILGLEAIKIEPGKSSSKATSAAKKEEAAPAPVAKGGAPAPLDDSLAALAPTVDEALKNPALDMAQLTFKGRIGTLRLLGADFKNINSVMTYNNRTLKIEKAEVLAYDGKMNASLQVGLKHEGLTYGFNSGLTGVEFEKIMGTHVPTWKQTVTGRMTGTAALSGKGLRKDELDKNLSGSLSGKIIDGYFDLPMNKIVGVLADSMPKITKFAKSVGVDVAKQSSSMKGNARGKFKTMDLDAKIQGRNVLLDRLEVEYDPNYGGGQILFKAKGNADFDQKISLVGTLFIEPKLLKLDGAKALVGKSGLAELPVKMTGTISEPKPDYGYTLEYVGKKLVNDKLGDVAAKGLQKALGNEGAAALGNVLSNPKKIDDKTKKQLGNALKNLFK